MMLLKSYSVVSQAWIVKNSSPTKTPGYALTMTFDGHEVKSSDYLKILGVTIENRLTFLNEHISDICMKTSCKVGVSFRLPNLIP